MREDAKNTLPGDRVEIRFVRASVGGRRAEAVVLRILDRTTPRQIARISGEYRGGLRAELAGASAMPTTSIAIPSGATMGARIGDVVIVEIDARETKANT